MGGIIFGAFHLCFSDEPFKIATSTTFNTVWFVTVTTICTMELYSGNGWVPAYQIGFSGTYCDKVDYVDFGNFNDYSVGVQFLIVTWFLF